MIKDRTEVFIPALATELKLHLAVQLSKQTQRSRKAPYRKKGLLYSTKGGDGPFTIVILEANSWPEMSKLRVQMEPNESLDFSTTIKHSLWTFLAHTASNNRDYDYNLGMAFNLLGMRYTTNDEADVFAQYKLGVMVQLWHRSAIQCKKLACIMKPKYKKVALLKYYAETENELKEAFNWCPKLERFTRSFLTAEDLFECSITNVWYCDNINCGLFFLVLSEFENHMSTCVNGSNFEPKVTYKQKRMSEYHIGEQLLADLGLQHSISEFCTYDIETCTEAGENTCKKRNQQIISICARKSWSDQTYSFVRKDSNTGSGIKLCEDFLLFLDEAQLEYKQRFCQLQDIRGRLKQFSLRANINKTFEVQAANQILDDLERLRVIAFNSEKYDLVCLYPYLCLIYGCKSIEFSAIKRGNGLMIFSTPKISFMDITNFCGKLSLAQFAKTYCTSNVDGKGIFPHDKFQTIEDIRSCETFPDYDAFQSALNTPTSDELEK